MSAPRASRLKLLVGISVLGTGIVGCKKSPPEPQASETLQLAPGIAVTVVATVDPDAPGAEFLCSTCYQTFPLRDVRIVPTYNESLGKYVGSNRCARDWKPSLAETRARLATRSSDAELTSFFDVFLNRGYSAEELRAFTRGKSRSEAGVALVDALEKGALKLTIDGRR